MAHASGRKIPARLRKADEALAEFGKSLPGAVEEWPWGERAIKVNRKTFVFMWCDAEGLKLSFKLRDSHAEALHLPFAEPTGYGLGKAGWVSARFATGDDPPLGILKGWILESYRLMAPKKLVARLDAAA